MSRELERTSSFLNFCDCCGENGGHHVKASADPRQKQILDTNFSQRKSLGALNPSMSPLVACVLLMQNICSCCEQFLGYTENIFFGGD